MSTFPTILLALASSLAAPSTPRQQPASPAPPPAPAPAAEPRVGVRFEGLLPGTHDPELEGEFSVEFRIYLSPQGGDAVWSETQVVRVTGGRMDVVLGAHAPIPMTIHEATFKFLGASVGGAREVYPRFTIVNTVFASPEEAVRPAEPPPARVRPPRAAAGELYATPGATVSARTEPACTWKEALLAARAAGGDLPDYQDWYAALAVCTREQALERSGHYEWVLPWVYDTASHGDYNRLFRGRFQGCDYLDLSPANAYPYRVATRPEPRPESAAGERKE
jgi:hypothetical protein